MLSFVAPVALGDTGRDHGDLERLSLLLDSFLRCFDMRDLGEFLIVTRPQDMKPIGNLLAGKGMDRIARLVDENDIVPELQSDPSTFCQSPRPNKGWFRQQLIKLACHTHVTTEFYMTLDADVIFVKKFSAATLLHNRRAILNTFSYEELGKIYVSLALRRELWLRTWAIKNSERVLGVSRSNRYLNGYTPVLLSRSIVASMADLITARYQENWRKALISQLPWTEYQLYFTFAEATGMLNTFHQIGGLDSVLCVKDSLVWPAAYYRQRRTLENWFPRPDLRPPEAVAVIVQSHLGHSGEGVRRALNRALRSHEAV